MEEFFTLKKDGSYEVVIEKSRFIATCSVVKTEAEAKEFVLRVRKKYPDATHNCYAFVTDDGGYSKFSDDGEPGGTAGSPMMNVLKSLSLVNVAVVVTRYFGGVKLGTGGLVRAYGGCVSSAVESLGRIRLVLSVFAELTLDYDEFSKFSSFSASRKIKPVSIEYSDCVKVSVAVKKSAYNAFIGDFYDFYNGKARVRETGEGFYPEEVNP